MKFKEIDKIKEIKDQIQNLDDILGDFENNCQWINERENRQGNEFHYTLNEIEKKRLYSSMGRKDVDINSINYRLLQSRDHWCLLLNREVSLKEEYSQEARLDRTKKFYSFLLRVCTAIGVVFVSILTLNFALYLELQVPSLLASKNLTPYSISSSTNHSVLSSIPVEETVLSKDDEENTASESKD